MLFKDVEKVGNEGGLKDYLGGIQKTMFWATWKPFVEGAELTYIIPAIGQDLYDLVTGSEPLAFHQKPLVDLLRRALAWYAYVDAFPSLTSTTGDSGVTVPTPANSQAISKWMYVAALKSHQDKADRYMEAALNWLERSGDSFPDWKASEFNTIQDGRLIRSATEATRYLPAIQNSRRLFLSLRGYFNQAEEDLIRPILGVALYKRLMAEQAAGQLEPGTYEYEALRMAKAATVQLGFGLAVPFLNMNTDFRLVAETDGIVNEGVLSVDRLNVIRSAATDKGMAVAAELKNYLNAYASATCFPEYFRSPIYVAPIKGSATSRQPENNSSNPYFIL